VILKFFSWIRRYAKHLLVTLAALLILVSLALWGSWRYLNQWLDTPMTLPDDGYYYTLAPGRSLGHLAHHLARDGYLTHADALIYFARWNEQTRVQAGEYFLPEGLTPRQLLAKLTAGEVVLHQVTLVEGWTFRQALAAIQANEAVLSQLESLTDEEILKRLNLELEHPEGWFFPDTYSFTRGTTDSDLLLRSYQRMQQVLLPLWEARAEGLPYQTPYDVLKMASIIERETGAPWEREKVAGVFVRRLQQGMRLQTDPTVIYGMGERFQGKITRADLRESTPYNTYVISGLPVTPIALPGRASIAAALNPEEGKELYFVAKGDGTTQFSETLEQHNQAVRRYQLQRRSDYRSTLSPESAR